MIIRFFGILLCHGFFLIITGMMICMIWLAVLVAQTPNTPIPKPEWYDERIDGNKNNVEVKNGK